MFMKPKIGWGIFYYESRQRFELWGRKVEGGGQSMELTYGGCHEDRMIICKKSLKNRLTSLKKPDFLQKPFICLIFQNK